MFFVSALELWCRPLTHLQPIKSPCSIWSFLERVLSFFFFFNWFKDLEVHHPPYLISVIFEHLKWITVMVVCEVKLFGMWAAPAVRRVEWALKLKGIEYEYIEEDLSNKSPSLLQYNPINRQVPVLLHNGKPLVESLVILEYIDETWKDNPILLKDPYERAMARIWALYSDYQVS